MNRILQFALIGFLVLGPLVSGCSSDTSKTTNQDGSDLGKITDYEIDYSQSLEGGKPAPDFQFQNPNGETLFLSDIQGKAVLLNFWQTRCPPCVNEMPYLQQVYEEWADKGLEVLAINVGEGASKVEEFMESNDLSLPVLLDTNLSVAQLYRVQAFPTTFLTDKDGLIQGYQVGAFQSVEQIKSGIKTVLQ
ncbi:MAG: TlpA family protein disulfide reductase [Dehalococcoidia bacterium]